MEHISEIYIPYVHFDTEIKTLMTMAEISTFKNFFSEQQWEVPRVQVPVPRHQQHRPRPPVHSTLRCGEHHIRMRTKLVHHQTIYNLGCKFENWHAA